MPPKATLSRTLSYRLRKTTGQAGVTLNEKDVYLGKRATKMSGEFGLNNTRRTDRASTRIVKLLISEGVKRFPEIFFTFVP